MLKPDGKPAPSKVRVGGAFFLILFAGLVNSRYYFLGPTPTSPLGMHHLDRQADFSPPPPEYRPHPPSS